MIIITILYKSNTPPSEQITHRPQRAQTTYILSQLCNYPPPPLYTLSLPHTTSHLSHSISPCTLNPKVHSDIIQPSKENRTKNREERKKNEKKTIQALSSPNGHVTSRVIGVDSGGGSLP